jgi:hypothetical protein
LTKLKTRLKTLTGDSVAETIEEEEGATGGGFSDSLLFKP